MYEFYKEMVVYKSITFATEEELKKFIEKYKEDCEYWYNKQEQDIPFEEYIKDEDMLEEFLDENYMYDWNTYYVDRSDNNIYDFYKDVEKFL